MVNQILNPILNPKLNAMSDPKICFIPKNCYQKFFGLDFFDQTFLELMCLNKKKRKKKPTTIILMGFDTIEINLVFDYLCEKSYVDFVDSGLHQALNLGVSKTT